MRRAYPTQAFVLGGSWLSSSIVAFNGHHICQTAFTNCLFWEYPLPLHTHTNADTLLSNPTTHTNTHTHTNPAVGGRGLLCVALKVHCGVQSSLTETLSIDKV
jgi:hypothetical protein